MMHEYSWVLQSHKVSSKSDQKQKKIINRTFCINKQLTLFFNFLQNHSLNFAQNFRECLFKLAKLSDAFWRKLKKSVSCLFTKNVLVIKNFCFWSDFDETLWDCSTHEYCWDNKNFWGAKSGPLTHAWAVKYIKFYYYSP